MEKISYAAIIIVMIVAVWTVADEVNLQSQSNINLSDNQPGTKITLRENATREFSPELAVINLGVQSEGEELQPTFEENNQKMKAITNSLQEMEGISVKNSNFNINTRRINDDNKENSKIIYRVFNQIQVETENINNLSQIIQMAVEAGANQVNSIRYMLKNKEQAKKEVTELALSKLKEKITFVKKNMNKDEPKMQSLNIRDKYIAASINLT